jgi:type IV pilus assembly protein PilV
MRLILRYADKGFTLIEVLVATMILMIGMLGLFTSINLVIDNNLRNIVRDDVGKIAERKLGEIKNTPFAQLTTSSRTQTVVNRTRAADKQYQVNVAITSVTDVTSLKSTNSKRVEVTVTSNYKGKTTDYRLSTIVTE